MRQAGILSTVTTAALLFGACAPQAFAAAPAATAAKAEPGSPQALIQDAAERMLKSLDANRAEYRKDPQKVFKVVDEVLLPLFDTEFAAQQVLAKHWRTATPEQRQRFIKAFYRSLLETYGTALLDFTADRMQMDRFVPDANPERATVKTKVKTSSGTVVPVNYSMRKTANGWKAWDVVIEGISYVRNFRADFDTEINQKGLDAVIKRLEAGGTAAKPTRKS